MKDSVKDRIKECAIVGVYVASCLYAWVGLHESEGWAMETALYVLVQIVTTVGYGDATPSTTHMKLFMVFFVIETLIVFAYYLNKFMERLVAKNEQIMSKMLQRSQSANAVLMKSHTCQNRWKLAVATARFLAAVLFGVMFYAVYESCTCSYGHTRIQGCTDDTYDACVQSGGSVKSYSDALYFSVITLTTVGFGDYTPKTKVGRWIGIGWMIIGVTCSANWFSVVTAHFYTHPSTDMDHRQDAGSNASGSSQSQAADEEDGVKREQKQQQASPVADGASEVASLGPPAELPAPEEETEAQLRATISRLESEVTELNLRLAGVSCRQPPARGRASLWLDASARLQIPERFSSPRWSDVSPV